MLNADDVDSMLDKLHGNKWVSLPRESEYKSAVARLPTAPTSDEVSGTVVEKPPGINRRTCKYYFAGSFGFIHQCSIHVFCAR